MAKKSAKKKPAKPKAGRKTEYKLAYVKIALKFCEDGHFSDRALAKRFDVDPKTIANWKQTHPKFAEAIKEGIWAFDNGQIEMSLRQQAQPHDEVTIREELTKVGPELLPLSKMTKAELIRHAKERLGLKLKAKLTRARIELAMLEERDRQTTNELVITKRDTKKNVVNTAAGEKILKVEKPEKYGDKTDVNLGVTPELSKLMEVIDGSTKGKLPDKKEERNAR